MTPTYVPAGPEPKAYTRRNPARMRRRPLRVAESNFETNTIQVDDNKLINTGYGRPKVIKLSLGEVVISLFLFVILGINCTSAQDMPSIFNSSENMAKYFGQAHICRVKGKHTTYILLPQIPICDWNIRKNGKLK